MDSKIINAPLSMLRVSPWQPRRIEGYVVPDPLVESIRKHGLLQVPVGRIVKNGDGDVVEIGDGWQRWQAYEKLSRDDPDKYGRLPVIVRDLSDQDMADLAVESNEKRNDLNPIELATFFRRYLAEFNVTQEQLADKFSMSQPAVANTMRLLNLQPEVRTLIVSQEITPTHGRALLKVEDAGHQVELARWAASEKPTVVQLDREILQTLKDDMRSLSPHGWPKPEFSLRTCEGCEKQETFRETQWTGSKNEIVDAAYCKDRKCWDRKQRSAEDKKRAGEEKRDKAKLEKVLCANPGAVPLDKLPYDSYGFFGENSLQPTELCRECKDFKKGFQSYDPENLKDVCTNGACFRNKKRADTVLSNRFADQQWNYRLQKLMAEVDMSGISAPICRILLDHLAEWRHIKVLAEELGMSGQNGRDFQDKVKAAAAVQDHAVQQKLVLRLLLENYHDRDRYNQRGNGVSHAMQMLLGKDRAQEIDKAFVPDLRRPAKGKVVQP